MSSLRSPRGSRKRALRAQRQNLLQGRPECDAVARKRVPRALCLRESSGVGCLTRAGARVHFYVRVVSGSAPSSGCVARASVWRKHAAHGPSGDEGAGVEQLPGEWLYTRQWMRGSCLGVAEARDTWAIGRRARGGRKNRVVSSSAPGVERGCSALGAGGARGACDIGGQAGRRRTDHGVSRSVPGGRGLRSRGGQHTCGYRAGQRRPPTAASASERSGWRGESLGTRRAPGGCWPVRAALACCGRCAADRAPRDLRYRSPPGAEAGSKGHRPALLGGSAARAPASVVSRQSRTRRAFASRRGCEARGVHRRAPRAASARAPAAAPIEEGPRRVLQRSRVSPEELGSARRSVETRCRMMSPTAAQKIDCRSC